MGRIHAATAGNSLVAKRFASDSIFEAIRIDPYLLATARAHPELEERLTTLASDTLAVRVALVHGDVSPKNILVGPLGPVFLDAECAWYGDPAFDLAFCLNHYLLKCLLRPTAVKDLLTCFDGLAEAYLAQVDWEPPDALQARASALLPALLLARVDGKSPVEYIQTDQERGRVRRVGSKLLLFPAERLDRIREMWRLELQT
jgi:Ser/Thr protein kinase RdoA (MazF antagonist)